MTKPKHTFYCIIHFPGKGNILRRSPIWDIQKLQDLLWKTYPSSSCIDISPSIPKGHTHEEFQILQ